MEEAIAACRAAHDQDGQNNDETEDAPIVVTAPPAMLTA
jgi:hypothetical protein